jgi:hypothetical protein
MGGPKGGGGEALGLLPGRGIRGIYGFGGDSCGSVRVSALGYGEWQGIKSTFYNWGYQRGAMMIVGIMGCDAAGGPRDPEDRQLVVMTQ